MAPNANAASTPLNWEYSAAVPEMSNVKLLVSQVTVSHFGVRADLHLSFVSGPWLVSDMR
jgi:hypothetical protein